MKVVGIAYPAQNPVLGEAQERFDGGGGWGKRGQGEGKSGEKSVSRFCCSLILV